MDVCSWAGAINLELLQTEGPALHYVRGTLLKKAEEVRGGDLSGVFHDVTRATPVRARAWQTLTHIILSRVPRRCAPGLGEF